MTFHGVLLGFLIALTVIGIAGCGIAGSYVLSRMVEDINKGRNANKGGNANQRLEILFWDLGSTLRACREYKRLYSQGKLVGRYVAATILGLLFLIVLRVFLFKLT